MSKLNTFVHVVAGDRTGVFGPGDQVPDWAVAAISNPDVWEEESQPPTVQTERVEPTSEEVKEPPRGGPGSSADAWTRFATSRGIDVPAGSSARDIQALWDSRY